MQFISITRFKKLCLFERLKSMAAPNLALFKLLWSSASGSKGAIQWRAEVVPWSARGRLLPTEKLESTKVRQQTL